MDNWVIGTKHKIYGKVVVMGIREGEPYRIFIDKYKVVSLIPLATLNLEKLK